MRSFTGAGYFRKVSLLLLTVIIACAAAINPVSAFQKKQADTVSTSGIQFTSIPTAADSLASKKKHDDSIKKAAAVKKSLKATEKPKTLWEIFIAGFLGGFAAFLMPCIYPMLPLTVSFFTKSASSRSRAILQSLLYGLSIIVIYVTLGLVITLIF